MKIIALPLILVSLVVSLAHAEPQSPRKNRWEFIGIADATNRHPLKSAPDLLDFGRPSKADYETYRHAYFRSLTQYCDSDSAYKQGLRGMEYVGQCDGLANEDEIAARWTEGLKKAEYMRRMYISTD